jgi:hypothetical protein
MFTDYRRVVAGVTLLLLSACSGEGDIRSPDLPRPFLISIGPVQCEGIGLPPAPVPVGFTSTCRVTECRIGVFSLEDGEVVARETTGSCPPLSFTSSAPDVATITDDGEFAAVAEGTTDIVASGEGLSSPPTTVTVTPACVASFAIQGPTSVVAGIPQPYDTTVTLSTGQVFPSTADTEWTPSGDVLPSFNNPERPNELNSDPLATEAVVVNIGATYTGEVAACDGTALTAALDGVSITPANLLPQPDGLCVDLDNGEVFQGCRADTGACEALSLDLLLTEPATSTQLVARARFDNGLECNVTEQTVFTPAETPDIIEVSNGEGGGSVTPLAVGDTTIAATFRDREAEVEVAVRAAQVLGANSVAVSSAPLTTRDSARPFACIGRYDLIAGLGDNDLLTGRLDLFAGAGLCDETSLDENGNCTAVADPMAEPPMEPSAEGFNSSVLLTDVTNARQTRVIDEENIEVIDIDWQSQQGYWDGRQCVSEGETPAAVGNLFSPNYPGLRELGENGVVNTLNSESEPGGALRVGFACVTATYTNPLDPDDMRTGGMTVLVLPATNDSLLSGSTPTEEDNERLCQSLSPLFTAPVLGALAGTPLDPLAQIELIPVLSAVTEIVDAVLIGLEPTDEVLQAALEGLSPATEPLVGGVLGDLFETIEGTVYDPLLCGVQTLLGAITGGDVTCDAL